MSLIELVNITIVKGTIDVGITAAIFRATNKIDLSRFLGQKQRNYRFVNANVPGCDRFQFENVHGKCPEDGLFSFFDANKGI